VGVLYLPRVPVTIFHLTGLGQVLWRLTWALPAAALAGVLATAALRGGRRPVVRLLPAAALCALPAVWGQPLWSRPEALAVGRPTYKRLPAELADARPILARVGDGDVVLAPKAVSQTLLILSGRVRAVSPRPFYTESLRKVPGGLADRRLALQRFADAGTSRERSAAADLRAVGVDLACLWRSNAPGRRTLEAAGWRPAVNTPRLRCLRPVRTGRTPRPRPASAGPRRPARAAPRRS
jgi:hypothetical protein